MAGTTPFSVLANRVATHVPGCPQPIILKEVREAAIRACEETLMWRYTEPVFALSPGIHEYPFQKPGNTSVHAIFSALLNNAPLGITDLETAISMYPEWADRYNGVPENQLWTGVPLNSLGEELVNEDELNSSNLPTLSAAATTGADPLHVTQITPDKYVVLPLPGTDRTYNMRMFYALKPKADATGMDTDVFTELERVIFHGALQQLMVMPKVVWQDVNMASYHAKQRLFLSTERRARANLGNGRVPMQVRIPRIA